MRLLLKNLVFTIIVPGTVAGWLPYVIATRGPHAAPGGWSLVTAAVLGALGLGVAGWCVWDFAATGRGTPAPIDPPTRLVTRGLYRHIRNPMYVGVLCCIAAWAELFHSARVAAYGVAVWLAFTLFVRFVEEPMLERRFGSSYEEYRRTTGRWMPRLARGAAVAKPSGPT